MRTSENTSMSELELEPESHKHTKNDSEPGSRMKPSRSLSGREYLQHLMDTWDDDSEDFVPSWKDTSKTETIAPSKSKELDDTGKTEPIAPPISEEPPPYNDEDLDQMLITLEDVMDLVAVTSTAARYPFSLGDTTFYSKTDVVKYFIQALRDRLAERDEEIGSLLNDTPATDDEEGDASGIEPAQTLQYQVAPGSGMIPTASMAVPTATGAGSLSRNEPTVGAASRWRRAYSRAMRPTNSHRYQALGHRLTVFLRLLLQNASVDECFSNMNILFFHDYKQPRNRTAAHWNGAERAPKRKSAGPDAYAVTPRYSRNFPHAKVFDILEILFQNTRYQEGSLGRAFEQKLLKNGEVALPRDLGMTDAVKRLSETLVDSMPPIRRRQQTVEMKDHEFEACKKLICDSIVVHNLEEIEQNVRAKSPQIVAAHMEKIYRECGARKRRRGQEDHSL